MSEKSWEARGEFVGESGEASRALESCFCWGSRRGKRLAFMSLFRRDPVTVTLTP